jgi:hypothetical protein
MLFIWTKRAVSVPTLVADGWIVGALVMVALCAWHMRDRRVRRHSQGAELTEAVALQPAAARARFA